MEPETYAAMAQLEETHWWFIARRKIISQLIKAHFQGRPIKILEIGSGTGGNSAMLSGFGTLDSIEKNAQAIALAQQKNPQVNYQPCDVPDGLENIKDRQYDLIVMLDVLEHIKEDQRTLQEVKKKLAPDGRLLISAPAHPFLWSQHDVIHHHFRRYRKKELLALVKQADLTTEYHTYINALLSPLIVSIRLFNRVFRRQHQNDEKVHHPKINQILEKIFAFEGKLIPRFKWPFGISHLFLIKSDR